MAWVWKVTEPSPTDQSGSSCLRAQSAGPIDVFGVGVGASLRWVGVEVPG